LNTFQLLEKVRSYGHLDLNGRELIFSAQVPDELVNELKQRLPDALAVLGEFRGVEVDEQNLAVFIAKRFLRSVQRKARALQAAEPKSAEPLASLKVEAEPHKAKSQPHDAYLTKWQTRLEDFEFSLLQALAQNADDYGVAQMSYEKLSSALNLSKAKYNLVAKGLHVLRGSGALWVEKKGRCANKYHLAITPDRDLIGKLVKIIGTDTGDPEGWSGFTYDRLAEMTSATRDQITIAINDMKDEGVLETFKRPGFSNGYRLHKDSKTLN
jgi:hypothetical protein